MPLGPRPEPPPIPRKHPPRKDAQRTVGPPLPPKYHSVPGSPVSPVSPSASWSPSSSGSSMRRGPLGPRPLATARISMPEPSSDLASPKLPYPVNDFEAGSSQIRLPEPSFLPMESLNESLPDAPNATRKNLHIPAELLPTHEYGRASQDTKLEVELDLPQIPPAGPVRSKFNAEILTVADFGWAEDIWALSGLARWLQWLVAAYDADFSETEVVNAIAKLFFFRVRALEWSPSISTARAAVNSFKLQGVAFTEEGTGLVTLNFYKAPSGVLPSVAGDGCYAREGSKLEKIGRCYAPRCLRELRPTLSTESLRARDLEMDWAIYWGVEPEATDIVKRQYAFHELIMSEEAYVRDLETYVKVYGEALGTGVPVMSDQPQFVARVFTRIRGILAVNQPLVTKLLSRQQQEGPFVVSISDLILEWAQNSTTIEAYSAYADDYLWAEEHLRRELAQNSRFSEWMLTTSQDPRIRGVPHSFFFHRVLPRVARYNMLLEAILKRMPEAPPEPLQELREAITAVSALAKTCDQHVERQQALVDVYNLRAHIVFKTPEVSANLQLEDRRRRLIRRGDVLRKGSYKVEWVATHLLLLDNFLVLSKLREGSSGTAFYVTKTPIPLDLLVVEQADEDPVRRSRLPGTTSIPSGLATTTSGNDEEELAGPSNLIWPLRITHLGSSGETIVLYCATRDERAQWAATMVEAQRSRAASLVMRSVEPVHLRVVTNEWAYPESEAPALPLAPTGSALHREIAAVPEPDIVIERRVINTALSFNNVTIIGTDLGVWVRPPGKGWLRALDISKVHALAILPCFNCLMVGTDRNLMWYPLDQVIARGLGDKRIAVGHRLNRQRRVTDFCVARYRGRTVVLYLQSDIPGLSLAGSTLIKIVEPVRSHGMRPMRGLVDMSRSQPTVCVDFFREIDRVTLAGDITSLTAFTTCFLGHHSGQGFDWFTLDRKLPVSLPTSGIKPKAQQGWGKPLGAFQPTSSALLLCYECCLVVCHADGSATDLPITWFIGKASAVAFLAPYLVVISPELVEIRNTAEFPSKLVQLMTSKDISLLSKRDAQKPMLRVADPWTPGRQLLIELSL